MNTEKEKNDYHLCNGCKLPDQFIYYASRTDPIFQNRSMKMFDWTEEVDSLFAEIPIPNDLIVCDSCNARIETEKIALLIQMTEDPNVQLIRQAVCKVCDEKYFSDFIHIGSSESQKEEII
jgi:hypothetical protein